MAFRFENAFYIKLGQGGKWEADAILNGYLRLGWRHQSIADINNGEWGLIEGQLKAELPGKAGVVTNDLNQLRRIVHSTPEDIWITFHQAKLWWARLIGQVEVDQISKFRRTVDGWHDLSLTGRRLILNDLPGKIAQLQGFRGTVCRVLEPGLLRRVLEGVRSELANRIGASREALCHALETAIRELHWKDYETLVDLVFRHAGWERVSVLGQHAKAYDLELREPITGDRYVVQVKSQATWADLEWTIQQFSQTDFRKVFFVVHSPSPNLTKERPIPPHIELVDPFHLADLAQRAGLSNWIEDRVA